MTKIIHILSHSPPPAAYQCGPNDPPPKSTNPSDDQYAIKIDIPPYWICFAQNDWHAKLAHEIRNKTDEFELECWRPYQLAKKVYSKNIRGVVHRLFPADKVSYGCYQFGERSIVLLKMLNDEIARGDIIVHLHGLHDNTIDRLLWKMDAIKTPVIVTQRGGAFPGYFLRKKPWLITKWLKEKLMFNSIDLFIIQSIVEYEYIRQTYGYDRVIHLQDGLDFSQYKDIGKRYARGLLGIDTDAKVLLYVGGLILKKGVHNILWAYKRLKEQDPSYQLYCVGAYETDELYNLAKKTDCYLVPRTTPDELVKYYSAADVTLYPTDDEKYRDFAGISNANIESLATNTPLYTSQLIHFMGTEEERDCLGLQYIGREGMLDQISQMMKETTRYSNCREIAAKYYDRSKNTERVIAHYKDLQQRYGMN